MHLYAITRGQKDNVDRFINDLLAQAFEFPIPDPHEKDMSKKGLIQLGVRPIQLWEIAFPKEALYEVLNTMCPDLDKRPLGYWQTKFNNQLRRLLRCKKIPAEIPKGTLKRFTNNAINGFVEVFPIGIKEDRTAPGFELI